MVMIFFLDFVLQINKIGKIVSVNVAQEYGTRNGAVLLFTDWGGFESLVATD